MTKFPQKTLERNLIAAGHGLIVGVDEVGMGCLAGPVVVCALAIQPEFFTRRQRGLERLRDSKLLTPAMREYYATQIMEYSAIRYAVSVVSAAEVDRLNVYQAARMGMRRAIRRLGLNEDERPHVLVDGPHIVRGVSLPQTAIVRGDRTVFAIAAASVLAKVYRDSLMVRLARRCPGYGLEVHKGYATRAHREALALLGPSDLHRRSFRL